MPTAWLVDVRSGATRTVTGSPSLDGSLESVAIGWAPDGRAIDQVQVADAVQWALGAGLIENDVPYDEIVDDSFLP